MKISEHLSIHEVECVCGCKAVASNPGIMSETLIYKFEQLRAQVGVPIIINSGFRCSWYQAQQREREIEHKKELYKMTVDELYENRMIWHSLDSLHCKGMALDMKVRGLDMFRFYSLAVSVGFTGVGLYPTFIHGDVRRDLTFWRKR